MCDLINILFERERESTENRWRKHVSRERERFCVMNRRIEESVEDGGMIGVMEDYESMIGARKLRVRRDEKKGNN